MNSKFQSTASLRRRLQAMTEEMDVSRHPELLRTIERECPNTIKILLSPHPIGRYTCLVHALQFAEDPEYVGIAEIGFGGIFAGREFANRLIDRRILSEIAGSETQEGDLVFYFDSQGQFQHAGVTGSGGRIQSKWGTGHLFDHPLFEVPDSYGNSVRFFKHVPYEKAIEEFIRFARDKGMPIEV